jgi:alpha-beta hydrolase superfamily lysophospholipase
VIKLLLKLGFGAFGFVGQLHSWPWRKDHSKAETYPVTTKDGWTHTLYRVRGQQRPENGPVLLQHGLGASSYSYHFPGRSVAEYLAENGFDVWISDLRGRCQGIPPGPGGKTRYDWEAEDYVDHDIPSFIEKIKAETGYSKIQMAGHSMGGVLLYMYGIKYGTDTFSGCVITASSLDYRVGKSGFTKLTGLKKLVDFLPWVPYGAWCRFITPLVGRFHTKIESFNYNTRNVSGHVARIWYANVFQNISPGVLKRLSTTFDDTGFKGRDDFEYLKHAGRFKAPVLAMGGDVDPQVSPEAIKNTIDCLGSEETKVRIFGPEFGDKNSYGHADLLVGDEANQEVWPELLAFLKAHKPTK